jgi:hypothetical protein
MARENRKRPIQNISKVKKDIFANLLIEAATPRRIFIDKFVNDKIKTGDMNIKDAKTLAANNWLKVNQEQRQVYKNKKEEPRELYDNTVRKPRLPRLVLIPCSGKDTMMKARENNQRMRLKECADAWNNLNKKTKEKYEAYAREFKEEWEKKRNLNELPNIKLKKPLKSYNFFLMEPAKEGKFTG